MPGRILGSGVMACALDKRELAAAQPMETDPWAAQGAQVGPDSLQRPRYARGRALSCLAGPGDMAAPGRTAQLPLDWFTVGMVCEPWSRCSSRQRPIFLYWCVPSCAGGFLWKGVLVRVRMLRLSTALTPQAQSGFV